MSAATNDLAIKIHNIDQEIRINAPVEKVFTGLLDVNGWWSHRYARIPDSLRLEAKVGGRFWETRDGSEENGMLWGMVESIEPNDHLVLTGGLGMQGAVLGSVTICTVPQDDSTTLVTVEHQFMGAVPESYLNGFTQGWVKNLDALQNLSEKDERLSLPG